jgi:hypothetical protein
MARIFFPLPLARGAKGLAWIPSGDDVDMI